MRAERENELALREKNQRLAEIQQGIDEVNKQKAQQQSLLAQKESERQHELVILENQKTLSTPILPMFDYAIAKLDKMLDKIAGDADERRHTDFLGETPSIYGSNLEKDEWLHSGTNFISIGTNSAWKFEISTMVTTAENTNFALPGRFPHVFAVMKIICRTTNGVSNLILTPDFVNRFENRWTAMEFQSNQITNDPWLHQLSIILNVPNGLDLNMVLPF